VASNVPTTVLMAALSEVPMINPPYRGVGTADRPPRAALSGQRLVHPGKLDAVPLPVNLTRCAIRDVPVMQRPRTPTAASS
jgi:hypothetical protein